MPTVIDSLVVELELDPTKLNKGQRQALEAFRKTKEEAVKGGKDIEEQAKKSGEAIGGIKTQVLELFGALGGAAALIGFAANITGADAAVGRLSRSTGISATEISKWQGVARIFGGDAATMAQSFTAMSDSFAGWKVGVISPLIADFRAISTAGGTIIDLNKGVEQSFLDLSANLHNIALKDPALAGMLGRRAGIDPGLLDILLKGPEATKKMLDYATALGAATKTSTDQAGELAKAWNSVVLAIEGKGRTGLTAGSDGLSISGALALMLNTIAKDLSTPRQWFGGLKNTTGQEWLDAILMRGGTRKPDSSSGGGAFTSQTDKEAFIRSEAAKRGLDPDVMVKVARSEGFDKFLGDNGTSGSAFQLHVTPGGRGNAVGDQFQKTTGLSPLDPANERAAIQFALDDIRAHGLSAYHGAARVGLGPSAGGAGQGGSTSTSSISITGPITINAGPNADGTAIANKFIETVKRQGFAAQANDGQN